MKVLVIYEIVSEETLKAIVEMTNDEYMYFKKAHNVFVNVSDCKESEKVSLVISEAFCDNPEYKKYCETEIQKKYFGLWKNDKELTDIKSAEKTLKVLKTFHATLLKADIDDLELDGLEY